MLILETSRLILRPFQDSDLEPFVAYRSDPEVARYQGWDMPYSVDKAIEFISEMKLAQPTLQVKWYQLAIEQRQGGQLAGDCAFHAVADDARQAEVGLTLARPYQGKGMASKPSRACLITCSVTSACIASSPVAMWTISPRSACWSAWDAARGALDRKHLAQGRLGQRVLLCPVAARMGRFARNTSLKLPLDSCLHKGVSSCSKAFTRLIYTE